MFKNSILKNPPPPNLFMKYFLLQIVVFCSLCCSFCFSQTAGKDSSVRDVQIAQVEMVKSIIIRQMTPEVLKGIADRSDKLGIREYSYYFKSDKMGWMLKSKDGWELAYITIDLGEGKAQSGEYLGAVAKDPLAKQIHDLLVETMNKTYRLITRDEYDIGGNCTASISLFKGSTGLGRSRIVIKRKS